MATAGSPTVRRRRLAAELRRLRATHSGKPTGSVVARALGWSPAKISRYELGQGGFPPDEVEKLLDYYEVPEPRRTQLLNLAEDANARGWWEDYADILHPGYLDFVGLEAEASSVMQWQVETIPGLLQTREYARRVNDAFQAIKRTPPGIIERGVDVRMTRQEVLTRRDPQLRLSAALDESALLREIAGPEVMYAQLIHLVKMAELPNVELRVLPLRRASPLMASSFVIFDFSPIEGIRSLGDVVSLENMGESLSVEGEADTYQYRLLFEALTDASLSPEESVNMVRRVASGFRLSSR